MDPLEYFNQKASVSGHVQKPLGRLAACGRGPWSRGHLLRNPSFGLGPPHSAPTTLLPSLSAPTRKPIYASRGARPEIKPPRMLRSIQQLPAPLGGCGAPRGRLAHRDLCLAASNAPLCALPRANSPFCYPFKLLSPPNVPCGRLGRLAKRAFGCPPIDSE